MARRSKEGELQLGFDMAPVLPRKAEAPSAAKIADSPEITRAEENQLPDPDSQLPVDGSCRPASGAALRAAALPQSSAPVPTGLVPDSQLPATSSQLPNVLTVAQLTRRISSVLEEGIGSVWVEGEISNLRRQSSGHSYFTLKDEESQLSCVLFARTASGQKVALRDGLQVQLQGQISVYQPRGQYQLVVRVVQAKGEGLLQARFEELKRRLAAEGLFDQSRKRMLPRFPRRIGVVTSPTGAAIHDFLQVLHRRHPGLRVVINPVRVQGKGAAAEIAAAITELAAGGGVIGPVDLIVVTRGGGSLEDLWEFNEEAVARAIVASPVPVVSAVGHEIDFSIADFAADLRAPTPSAAAELIAAEGSELLERSRSLVARIGREALARTGLHHAVQQRLASSPLFRDPLRRVEEARQTSDRIEEFLAGTMERRTEQVSAMIARRAAQMASAHPGHRLLHAGQKISTLGEQLGTMMARRLERDKGRMNLVSAALAALNPEATLARGFSITRNAEGKVITSASSLKTGDLLRTTLADGEVESDVR
ncbi:MAG: exodeoxyribonuclease VII large subunit [Chthoniobacterales bacterium]